MSVLSQFLEDFGSRQSSERVDTVQEHEGDPARLASYEEGFRAGWDEAEAAQKGNADRLVEEIHSNLRDLSFTYHEAHLRVHASVGATLEKVLAAALPVLVHDTIGERLKQLILDRVMSEGSQPVTISCSGEDGPVVESLLQEDFGFPVKQLINPGLSEGQVAVEIGDSEILHDAPALISDVQDLLAEFRMRGTERNEHD